MHQFSRGFLFAGFAFAFLSSSVTFTAWAEDTPRRPETGAVSAFSVQNEPQDDPALHRIPANSNDSLPEKPDPVLHPGIPITLNDPLPAQAESRIDTNPQPATRIETDQKAGVIRFIVNGKEEGRFDKDGLRLPDGLYPGVIRPSGPR